jgi:hypothetical protein
MSSVIFELDAIGASEGGAGAGVGAEAVAAERASVSDAAAAPRNDRREGFDIDFRGGMGALKMSCCGVD